MKNGFLFIFMLFVAYMPLRAQELTYGVLLGVHFKDIEVKGDGLSAGGTYSAFNYSGFPLDIGGYIDFELDKSFGIKTNLFYSRAVHEYTSHPTDYQYLNIFLLMDQIHLQPMVKYDLNKDYNKGFYLLAGPRASFIISSKFIERSYGEADTFYKKTNFGLLLGFGSNFSRWMGFEIMGDYGISNLLDNSGWKTRTIGANLNLYLNLEAFLSR